MSAGIIHECAACGATVAGHDLAAFGDAFLAHVRADHADWPYPDVAVRNYAEATQRLTGSAVRLEAIGAVEIHRVTEDRIDDWLGFFDHDAFVGKPEWAACYCTEPHLLERGTPPEEAPHRAWQENRTIMVDMLRAGASFGYLAYAGGRPAGWVNASRRADQALYRMGERGDVRDEDVAAISCFIVAPPYRGHGLAGRLLDTVIADAPGRGVSWLEAYPFSGDNDGQGSFRGSRVLFESRSFEVVKALQWHTVMRRPVAA